MTKQLVAINTANDTFQVWVDRFNEVITVVNTEVVTVNTTAGISTGNGYVNGYFGANTLFATDLRGGNLSTSDTLLVTSNVSMTGDTLLVNSNVSITGNGVVNGHFGGNTLFAVDLRGGNLTTSNTLLITSNVSLTGDIITIGNSSVNSTINSTSFSGTSANSINLNNQPASYYTNATNLATGTVPTARLGSGTANSTTFLAGDQSYKTSVTSVATSSGLTGGTITTTGTISVLANNGITANTTGLYVTQGTGTVVNATGVHVNSAYIGTLTANNSTNLGGQPASYYTNATNLATGTVPTARLGSGTADSTTFLAGDQSYKTSVTSVATSSGLTGGTITSTGTISVRANNGITANATGLYVTQGTGTVVNSTGVHVNTTYIGTLTANNSTNLGNQPASYYTNATNLATGTVPTARLGSGTADSTTFLAGDQSYKVALTAAVTSVSTGNGLTGGPITSTGTVSVLANDGITANATGLYVTPGTGIVVNTSGVHVNSAYISSFVVDVNANTSQYSNGSFTNTFTVGTASYFVGNGNLGIGNTTPAHKLRVEGDISIFGGVHANGSLGSSGQVLFSNGTVAYWADAAGGSVSSVNSGNGLTGGPITTTGTLSILANNGITANATGLYVRQGTGTVVNATGVHVNTTYIGTLNANNATFFNNQPASYYTNATNLATGTVPTARLGSGTANSTTFLAGDQSYKQVVTSVTAGVGLAGGTITNTGTISISAKNGITANSIGLYVTPGTGIVVNTSGVHVNSTFVQSITVNNANNASFLGTVAAASYQLNSTLAANVATLPANSALYANASVTNTFTVGTSTYFVSNGNIGVSNTTPAHKLRVEGDISVSGGIHANGSLGSTNQALFSNGTGVYWATIIGTTLTANNTDTQTFYLPMSNTTSGSWSNGVVSTTKLYFVPSTGTLNATEFNSLSDISYKENIDTIQDALSLIKNIDGISFNWKDTGKKSLGVSAQQLEKILPQIVTNNLNTKTVNYNGLIAVLLQAIKELQVKVELLNTDINKNK